MLTAISSFSLIVVPLVEGPALAVHHADGPLRPFLLLPGDPGPEWDDVALRLNQVGHAVAAAELDDAPGRDVDDLADGVAHLVEVLDLRGARAPIVAGAGRGGAVALSLAARRGGVAGVACLDGGWARAEAGPDPRAWFPLIDVPTLLRPARPAATPGGLTEDLLRLAGQAEPGPADRTAPRERPGDLPGYLPLLDR